MIKRVSPSFWGPFLIAFAAVVMFSTAGTTIAASTIQGTIYDKRRNPLVDVDVELLDQFNRLVQPGGRTKTDGTGSYGFGGLSDGRYTVRVLPFRFDLEDQERMVTIESQNIRGGEGTVFLVEDFFLSPKKGGLADAELGVVFAQNVPDAARRAFERAEREFSKGRRNDGFAALNEALSAFPKYFDALHRAGKELFFMGKFEDAVPFLLRAADVNNKSAYSFYYLGVCLTYLKKDYHKAANTALTQAMLLAPQSAQVAFSLGKVQRSLGNFSEAEANLLKAKRLTRTSVPEYHKELAQLYANDMKKFKEAADELDAYLKASDARGPEADEVKKLISTLREKAKSQPSKS